ncbi:MAG: hypothetical protein OXE41_00085 [Gammaproteobacteria bacterium]|nr:hypothetical protein [Gammaproteobacteria bacterium]MCY4273790.1 hypothetical protein [Gammaproteobacteria bacterium]
MIKSKNYELSAEIVVLKQIMGTHKQEYKTDMARPAEQMVNWKTDMSTNMALCKNRQLLGTITIVGLASTVLGLLIST